MGAVMPRKQRLFVEGGVYHVYCRVSRRDGVFLSTIPRPRADECGARSA